MNKQGLAIWFFLIAFMAFLACSDSDDGKGTSAYDPNKPVELTRFFPDSGGIRSKIMLEGSNFGSDTANIKVYFNEKRAAVVSAQGVRMYAIAPRLPGDTCDIKVVVGDQEAIYSHKFRYKAERVVSTITGAREANEGKFQAGPLTTATLADIKGLAADKYGNVFISMQGATKCVARVDIPGNSVMLVSENSGDWNGGELDPRTQIAYFAKNDGNTILELNPTNLWVPRIKQILHPSAEEIEAGKKDFEDIEWKHSLAFNPHDNMMYVRAYDGQVIRFDPKTYVGELVAIDSARAHYSDSYVAMDPIDPTYLYISYEKLHCIFRLNLKTLKFELYTGNEGQGSWRDGDRKDAEFNGPKDITFDSDGILYIADRNNHCVRQIDRDGMVTTTAGVPQKWGTTDGPPDIAQFDNPFAVAVDAEGNIYIGEDANNRMLRKLTLE